MTKHRLPPDHGWYLYGIAKQTDAQSRLPDDTFGVNGSAPLTAIEYGELAALVSAVPLDEFSQERVRTLAQDDAWLGRITFDHGRVVDALQRRLTLLPAGTFSVYASDDEIRTALAERHSSFLHTLQKLAAAASGRVALLRAAQAWDEQGLIHTAIDGYTRLLRRYPGSIEGREAFDRLLELGHVFENEGHYHEALSLFDQVEKLEKLTYLVADSETQQVRLA